MSDGAKETTADSSAVAEADERLDDLEPAEDDNAAVRGGGPKNQTIQTGGGPIE